MKGLMRTSMTAMFLCLGATVVAAQEGHRVFVALSEHARGRRCLHTQSLLPDGRVLLAGGFVSAEGMLPPGNARLEIFDPRTGTFADAGDSSILRAAHTATTLADDRVVLIGGTALFAVECFDPHTGQLSEMGKILTPRAEHEATLLPDGKILVTGGITGHFLYRNGQFHRRLNALAVAEIFDPVSGTSVRVSPMLVPRRGHTQTLLGDGTVLITGGSWNRLCERFDPRTGKFTPAGQLRTAREDHRASVLADGKVLLSGGSDERGKSLASAEILDPERKTSDLVLGPMSQGREDHTATTLADGTILITGGEDNQAGPDRTDVVLGSVELFDPRTQRFTRLPDLTVPRDDHRATLLGDGRVFIFGGESASDVVLDTGELYVP